jgi:ABC-type transporter Mla maintaining outer membrane lipid asymmetry ATPase subunit MlaF
MSAVLGYEPVPDGEVAQRIWLDAPGTHCLAASCKAELLAAIHDMRPPHGARLFVLGADVGLLPEAERVALLGRVGFVPADGGLLSSLNGWENIVLPVSYHSPRRLPQLYDEVRGVLEDAGGVDERLLAKLPEEMSLYEKRLCAYARALLEMPRLLVVDSPRAGLGPTKRRRAARFAETYHARCPGGTYVELDEIAESTP